MAGCLPVPDGCVYWSADVDGECLKVCGQSYNMLDVPVLDQLIDQSIT